MPQESTSIEPVVIAGLGSAGRRHLQNLRSLGCRRFILYRTYQSTMPDDVDVGDALVTTDWQAVLSHQPKTAIVANPTAKHVDTARAAIEAGCDVFIEKPLSHATEGCQQLAETVARQGLVAMIGCQFRFHPLLVKLREQLKAGRLGTVLGARAEWGEYLPDWHPWEDYRQGYAARADLGGGVLWTLIHPLDYMLWLFGRPRCTHASISRVPSLQTHVDDDWAEITIEFSGGVIGQVHLDYVQKPPVHTLHVWGDAGRAVLNFHDGTLTLCDTDGRSHVQRVPEGFERNTMFVDEMREFLDACRQRRPAAIPLEDGIAALEIVMHAKQYARKEPTNV